MACIWPHLACISRMPSSTLSEPDFVTCSSILVPSQPFFSLTAMSPCLSSLSSMEFSSSGDSLVVFCMRPNFVMPFRMASSTMISFETGDPSSRSSMSGILPVPLKSLFNSWRPPLWPFGSGSGVGAAMQFRRYLTAPYAGGLDIIMARLHVYEYGTRRDLVCPLGEGSRIQGHDLFLYTN